MKTDLTARVARLEKEARLWRLLAVTGLACGSAVALTPQVTAQGEGTTVKAPLRVTDDQGKLLLSVRRRGQDNHLILHGPDAGIGVSLSTGANGADVIVNAVPAESRDGKGAAVIIEASRDIGPRLLMHNTEGKTVTRLPAP